MVNRHLQPMILQVNQATRSEATGAINNNWVDQETIQVKLIKTKASTVVNGVRSNIVNYKGVTKAQVNKEINRLVDPATGMIFYIDDSIYSLWNNLDLRVAEVF